MRHSEDGLERGDYITFLTWWDSRLGWRIEHEDGNKTIQ